MHSGDTSKEGRVEHLSDHGLLALIGRGDRDAFARLYDLYGPAAYSLAARIVRDRELAADVVQNVFLAVWTGATQFDPARGQPSTWIMTMTHHKAVDMVRREQRRRTEPLDVVGDHTDDRRARRRAGVARRRPRSRAGGVARGCPIRTAR